MEDLIDKVVKACEPEIQSYYSQVTPGEGRSCRHSIQRTSA